MTTEGRTPSRSESERPGEVRYSIYGLDLVSGHPFDYPVPRLDVPEASPWTRSEAADTASPGGGGRTGRAAPMVRFELTDAPPNGTKPVVDRLRPIFDDRAETADGVAGAAVYLMPDFTLMRFNDAADFYIWPDRVACHLYDGRYAFAIEIWLFGTVLSYVLELHGMPALHASAVEVDGVGVGFLASNKGGKSSLAAAFVQAGRRLVSDDILALDITEAGTLALPGYPQMRMWPEQADRLIGSTASLHKVQPSMAKLRVPITAVGRGGFQREPVPLAALYLPERDTVDGPVRFERLPASQALAELLRNSFLATIVHEVGWTPKRFKALAEALRDAPLKRVRFRSGVEHLASVVDAIARDVASEGS